ncbi:mitotic checkpoint protein BUB3-like [Ciona intestinalis]|nr:mitotic checkpoint protein BUB3-like [Ciona intestinalis]|eukprot:XP_002129118.1 mitotic checkpoint protein BUB3-like [Ciona intestinalis]
MANEFKLNNCPTDGISSVKFSPSTSQFLLASSWDMSVRLYDVTENSQRFKYEHKSPVLDCCFSDSVHSWSGGLDGSVMMYDLNTGRETVVGRHNNSIRCVEYCSDTNVVVTGSWDQTIKLWDPRSHNNIGSYSQPGKVFTMSVCGDHIIVGTCGKSVVVWDLRNMGYVEQRRESSLKYQTRCIKSFPNKQGYVLSSIEGRVAVEYLDPSVEVQKKKYAFKCHRIKENGIEHIYSVHAIAFHQRYSTFATGGADGYVNMWDGFNKKRLCQFHLFPAAVSSLAFSNDGSMLAVASSPLYGAELSPSSNGEDAIYIRHVTDAETKPKTSSGLA